jgi:endoglucanase
MKWFGINESGAEFGEKNFTGVYGKEYTWYDLNTIDKFMAEGMNMFRLNFRKLSYLDTQYHNRSKKSD